MQFSKHIFFISKLNHMHFHVKSKVRVSDRSRNWFSIDLIIYGIKPLSSPSYLLMSFFGTSKSKVSYNIQRKTIGIEHFWSLENVIILLFQSIHLSVMSFKMNTWKPEKCSNLEFSSVLHFALWTNKATHCCARLRWYTTCLLSVCCF